MYIELSFMEKKYALDSYNFSLDTAGDDTKLVNCVPSAITMQLHVPVGENPGADFVKFASLQHGTAENDGKGTITVFKAPNEGGALQTITFSEAWITTIDLSSSEHDDQFAINMTFAAANLTISGNAFSHRGRSAHFPKKEG